MAYAMQVWQGSNYVEAKGEKRKEGEHPGEERNIEIKL